MNRDDAKVFLRAGVIAAILVIGAAMAYAEDPPRLPLGVTCEAVRTMVAEHGKVYAYAWARLQGYTAGQIAEAKRCLK